MKAQMTIEFIVAAVLFFSLVLYIIIYLNAALSEYREEFYINDLQSRAVQIADLLVFNREVGISGGYPVINTARVSQFNKSCNDNYPSLLRTFDIRDHRIKIELNESETGKSLMDCPEVLSLPGKATKVDIMRFGVLDTTNQTAILNLWVW